MSTLTVQPDSTTGVDSLIRDTVPTTNFGTSTTMNIGFNGTSISRFVISFDLSAIPAGQTISAATLTIKFSGGVNAITSHVYRCTRTPTNTGMTWNTYDGTNNWTTPGGDFTTTDGIATTAPKSTWTLDVTVLAQDAYTLRGKLLSLLAKSDSESTNTDINAYSTSNDFTTANRPKLVVTYAPAASTIVQRRRPFTRAGSRAVA